MAGRLRERQQRSYHRPSGSLASDFNPYKSFTKYKNGALCGMFRKLFSRRNQPENPKFEKGRPDLCKSFPEGSFRFVAVDVETANGDPGSICQIGMACVDAFGSVRTFCQLVDPKCHFESFNIKIHGIRPQDVDGLATFEDIVGIIAPALQDNQLVQHSSFDSRALQEAYARCSIPIPALSWHDSVKIARRAWPELKGNGGHGLANLKSYLDLEFQHHDAGEDARAAAEIVLKAEAKTGLDFVELSRSQRKSEKWQPSVKMSGESDGPLFGQVAVFTGSLSMSRTQAARLAAKAGVETKAGVSKKVTLLIVGDQDLDVMVVGETKSSKHRRAEDLIAQGYSIRIMGETEFLGLVAAHP